MPAAGFPYLPPLPLRVPESDFKDFGKRVTHEYHFLPLRSLSGLSASLAFLAALAAPSVSPAALLTRAVALHRSLRVLLDTG